MRKINNAKLGRARITIKLTGGIFGLDVSSNELKTYAEMFSDVSESIQPIIITGGGEIARHYINVARELGSDEASLDILGIEVSRLNASLLIATLGDKAYPSVPRDLEQVSIAASSDRIVVCGGLHPGQSTNATSALIAEKLRALKLLNATDVEGIYDSDPNTNKKAKLFKEITVRKCFEILGSGNSMAGTYDLMDIVALKVIERSKIPTVVLRCDPSNIRNHIKNKTKAIGTEIVPLR